MSPRSSKDYENYARAQKKIVELLLSDEKIDGADGLTRLDDVFHWIAEHSGVGHSKTLRVGLGDFASGAAAMLKRRPR